MHQVVERLFSLLSDCMWETPIAQAKHAIQIKEKEQEMKLQVMKFYFLSWLNATELHLPQVFCPISDRSKESLKMKMRIFPYRKCPLTLRKLSAA